jgi:ABC-type phosphate transport system substrate-binding protein
MPDSTQHVAAQSLGPLAVIVSPDLSEKDISLALLKRAFKGDVTEFAGVRLVPFNYAPNDPNRNVFDKSVLGFPPAQVGAYWVDRRIRGQGMAPRTVREPQVMKAVVAKLRGAIGYIPAAIVDKTVSALSINGVGLKAADYPIK